MSDQKKELIDYTSRDFESIRSNLIEYAQRYYPDTFQDFNEASFGMMMLDTVSYVGDVLSFYLDYQANESFLSTATELKNVNRLARQLGYQSSPSPAATGLVSLYILVPASSSGNGPDQDLIPTLEKGSRFSTVDGNTFMLTEDVDFGGFNTEVAVGRVDNNTGEPSSYAIKAKGEVVSGELSTENIQVGSFERFRRVELNQDNISEVVSVFDSEGREYHEVQNLAQEVIYKASPNHDENTNKEVSSVLKPVSVPRRFTYEKSGRRSFLQFGFGSEKQAEKVPDPSKVALEQHGKQHYSDTTFDPTKILNSDTLGISPSNTTLTIQYRVNTVSNANASVGDLNSVSEANFRFENPSQLSSDDIDSVISSIEVDNEEPIVGSIGRPTTEEIKHRSRSYFTTQDRIVTVEDYKSFIYSMPDEFGSVKRLNAVPDSNSLERKVNVYVVSEDSDGQLITPNSMLKKNIKNWVSRKKPINDHVEIFDAKIVNLAIEFAIAVEQSKNRYDVLKNAIVRLQSFYSSHKQVGDNFSISKIYNELNDVDGVVDAVDVKISRKTGNDYSDVRYNILQNITPDGRMIHAPKNVIFEVRKPLEDIEGEVV